MIRKLVIAAIALVVISVLIQQTFFVVDVMEHAVVTLFGKPVRVYADEPGLKVKIPFLHRVYRFDNRLCVYESADAEYLTIDKTNIVINFYALWRVEEPLLFFKSIRDRSSAESKLDKVISSRLGSAFGKTDFSKLINTDTAKMQLGKLLENVLGQCRDEAGREYGVKLVDLRLKRLSFPDQVRQSVLDRIRSERQAKSSEIRSEGRSRAREIRAEAEYQRKKILAEADRQARVRIGEGEATAARLWHETLEENIDFYQFQRRLEVYEKSFDEDTVLFIPADSPLMELLLEGPQSGLESSPPTSKSKAAQPGN